jgi:hypothetical protein
LGINAGAGHAKACDSETMPLQYFRPIFFIASVHPERAFLYLASIFPGVAAPINTASRSCWAWPLTHACVEMFCKQLLCAKSLGRGMPPGSPPLPQPCPMADAPSRKRGREADASPAAHAAKRPASEGAAGGCPGWAGAARASPVPQSPSPARHPSRPCRRGWPLRWLWGSAPPADGVTTATHRASLGAPCPSLDFGLGQHPDVPSPADLMPAAMGSWLIVPDGPFAFCGENTLQV